MAVYDFEEKLFSGDDFTLPVTIGGMNFTAATVYFTVGDIDQDSEGVVIEYDRENSSFTIFIPRALLAEALEVSKKYSFRVQVGDSLDRRKTYLFFCLEYLDGDAE